MRGSTRKVSDSKPDALTTSKESDSIPMTYVGKYSKTKYIFLPFPFPLKCFYLIRYSKVASFDFNFLCS